ncbi:hypothetical protein Daus18300_012599 [Diaporthe australafricana]|uniref:Uncharacterized protein n=1 Tax=Diaporthe australafricana TaxID=127596 RepID=A0ABR3W2A0_9PEZI
MSPRSSVGHQHVVLSPLSTEFASDKSVDSGVGMSAQSDSLKSGGTRDSIYTADESHQGTKGSAATPSTQDGQAEFASEPAASDISDLVKNLQRVLSNSKSNITLNINSTNTPPVAADSPAHPHPPDSAAASDEVCRDKKGDACQCPACLKQRKLKEKPITYAVEYLDMGDRVVSTDTRQTEYDLDEELKDTKIRKSSTVFTVTTVLRTSIPADDYGDYLSKEEEKDKEQILKNKDCTIGFHTFRLTIVSPALLDALRTHIVHYPGVFLWGDELSITSPFCALAHHLRQLKEQRHISAAIKDDDSAVVSIEEQCRSKIPSAQTAEHLTMLLD